MSLTKEARIVNTLISNSISGASQTVTALIDTGADITCIPKHVAETLGLKPIDRVMLATASGHLEIENVIVNIKIEDQIFENVKVCILPYADTVLIGWDILSKDSSFAFFKDIIFRDIINIINIVPFLKNDTVLILGQDTTEIDRLRSIQNGLSELGYNGIIVKDITDIEIQSTEEKVTMLASLCRFVICENSTTSGHIDELKICASNRFVTAIIQQEGQGATWMQADYGLDFSFMEQFTYPSMNSMNPCVKSAVKWAERKVEERKEYLNNLYHWR